MKAWESFHKKTRYRFRISGIYLFDSVISLTKTSIHTATAELLFCYIDRYLFNSLYLTL